MSSDKQRNANKENAQKSTGPRTPEGKAKSSRNRYSHGFFSSLQMAPGEHDHEFAALCNEYYDDFKPANIAEIGLLEQVIMSKWNEMRAFRLQGQFLMHTALEKMDLALPKELGVLIRYQTTAANGYRKAMSELIKLQKTRREAEFGFDSQDAPRQVNITWINREEDVYPPKNPAPTPEATPDIVKTPDEAPPKAA